MMIVDCDCTTTKLTYDTYDSAKHPFCISGYMYALMDFSKHSRQKNGRNVVMLYTNKTSYLLQY